MCINRHPGTGRLLVTPRYCQSVISFLIVRYKIASTQQSMHPECANPFSLLFIVCLFYLVHSQCAI
jgi:hypothetical protein